MANEKNVAKKAGLWTRFMTWYESYNGKLWTGRVYSLGASVVIIGALFKILHWPFANVVLQVGMFTEAFLFAIGCLDKPHLDFHWDEVFPQIADPNGDPEHLKYLQTVARPDLAGGANANGATLPEKELESLKGSLKTLANTADQIADLSKVATATAKLGEKAEAAAEAAGKYAEVAGKLEANSEALNANMAAAAKNMESAVAGTKACGESLVIAGKSAAAVSGDLQKIEAAAAETAKSAAEAQAASAKLAKQIADLNNIYGNMLNAIA